jgi:hypothetical protein
LSDFLTFLSLSLSLLSTLPLHYNVVDK